MRRCRKDGVFAIFPQLHLNYSLIDCKKNRSLLPLKFGIFPNFIHFFITIFSLITLKTLVEPAPKKVRDPPARPLQNYY